MDTEYDDLTAALAEIFGAAGAGAPAARTPAPAPDDGPFGELIHSYSRAEALADGDLIEVPEELWRNQGFKHPVALTRAAWADAVAWDEKDNQRKKTIQDPTGRLWDVLTMAGHAARKAHGRVDRIPFQVLRTPREGRGRTPRLADLHLHVGPGDTPDPVLTILLPRED